MTGIRKNREENPSVMKQVINNKPRAPEVYLPSMSCLGTGEERHKNLHLIILDLELDPDFLQIHCTAVKDFSRVPKVCDKT